MIEIIILTQMRTLTIISKGETLWIRMGTTTAKRHRIQMHLTFKVWIILWGNLIMGWKLCKRLKMKCMDRHLKWWTYMVKIRIWIESKSNLWWWTKWQCKINLMFITCNSLETNLVPQAPKCQILQCLKTFHTHNKGLWVKSKEIKKVQSLERICKTQLNWASWVAIKAIR